MGYEELVPGGGKSHAARLSHAVHSLQARREQATQSERYDVDVTCFASFTQRYQCLLPFIVRVIRNKCFNAVTFWDFRWNLHNFS